VQHKRADSVLLFLHSSCTSVVTDANWLRYWLAKQSPFAVSDVLIRTTL